jgi:hypothetical protein
MGGEFVGTSLIVGVIILRAVVVSKTTEIGKNFIELRPLSKRLTFN